MNNVIAATGMDINNANTSEAARIVAELGFDICEFPPNKVDNCEKCQGVNLQLYFQGPTDAGRYLCLGCILKEHERNQEYMAPMDRLEHSV